MENLGTQNCFLIKQKQKLIKKKKEIRKEKNEHKKEKKKKKKHGTTHHKVTKKFMISSMTSEQKLRCTNSPETQFLQSFTKKKFMISST